MCKWRQVQNTYRRCGHIIKEPDVLIQCEDRFCKFSTTHPSNCGPKCSETCWQYRQFPEQYNPYLDRWCPACEHAGRGGRQ